jgi:ribosomal protein S18 acetylase RimI-like enzyme
MTIDALDADAVDRETGALVDLLRDAVESGASIGFLPPLRAEDAVSYWRSVAAAVREGTRIVLVARGDTMLGTAQLDLAQRPNGLHRAEVQKVIVHTAARRQGIGRALMASVEQHARSRGRTTLVLDTRHGDVSEGLYLAAGYRWAGIIPDYARSASGALHATAFYYKILAADGPARTA